MSKITKSANTGHISHLYHLTLAHRYTTLYVHIWNHSTTTLWEKKMLNNTKYHIQLPTMGSCNNFLSKLFKYHTLTTYTINTNAPNHYNCTAKTTIPTRKNVHILILKNSSCHASLLHVLNFITYTLLLTSKKKEL